MNQQLMFALVIRLAVMEGGPLTNIMKYFSVSVEDLPAFRQTLFDLVADGRHFGVWVQHVARLSRH